MCPSLIEIGSKTAEKNSAQTNGQTNRHYENNGHLAVNQQNEAATGSLRRTGIALTCKNLLYETNLEGEQPARMDTKIRRDETYTRTVQPVATCRQSPYVHSRLLSSCCYLVLFTVLNSGRLLYILSVCRPRPASHAHFRHRHSVTDTFLKSSVKLIVV